MSNILDKIQKQVENTVKLAGVKSSGIIVTSSLIEITVSTKADADKIAKAYKSQKFEDVQVFDLSEIGEEGFMININF